MASDEVSKALHRWRFHRVGGLDQVSLTTGADLANLDQLDPKLWVALGCPTRGLELDARTLEYLDADKDGRVRVPEILAAVRWCAARLADLASLVPGSASLPLAAVSTATPEGSALLGAARQILAAAGRADAAEVTVADVADLTRVFEKTPFNGDGVVPPEAAGDPETKQVIARRDGLRRRGGRSVREPGDRGGEARVLLEGAAGLRGLVGEGRGDPRRAAARRRDRRRARLLRAGPRADRRLLRPLRPRGDRSARQRVARADRGGVDRARGARSLDRHRRRQLSAGADRGGETAPPLRGGEPRVAGRGRGVPRRSRGALPRGREGGAHRGGVAGGQGEARSLRGPPRRQGGRGGGGAGAAPREGAPRRWREGRGRRAHRAGQGAGGRGERDRRRGPHGPLPARPAHRPEELRHLRRLLRSGPVRRLPGGHALPGRAQLRPVRPGGRSGGARGASRRSRDSTSPTATAGGPARR